MRAIRAQFPEIPRYTAAMAAAACVSLRVSQRGVPVVDPAQKRDLMVRFITDGPCDCSTDESCAERYALDLPGAV